MEITEPAPAAYPAAVGPAHGAERIISLDILRGYAVLGILLMNILGMGLPWWTYSNPAAVRDLLPAEILTYQITDMFVEGTLRTVFSMLFGAGIVLFTSRLAARDVPQAGIYYRRTVLLILFGLINGYIFIWWGDILFGYGVAGLLLYFARNWKARTLFIVAAVIFGLLGAARVGNNLFVIPEMMAQLPVIEAALEAGEELTEEQQATYGQYQFSKSFHSPPREEIDGAIAAYTGSLMDAARWNAKLYTFFITKAIFFVLFDVIVMMLLGMAFFKWGLFTATRSKNFYWWTMGLGYGLGLTVNYLESSAYIASGFSLATQVEVTMSYDVGRLSVALGHISLIMLMCKYEVLRGVRSALAKVGRMALTNYLMQSILAILIFWGLGLYNDLLRHELYLVVAAMWAFQIAFSVFWLNRYRFGPAEWVWRSLTYGTRQPMRRG